MTDQRTLVLLDASAHPRPGSVDERQLDEMISGGLAVVLRRHLWRRRDVAIRTHDIQVMRKPFNKAVLLRLLARGRCWFEDEQGAKSAISVTELLSLLRGRIQARWRSMRGVRALRPAMEELIARPRKHKRFGPGAVLYLRTDLVFGLKSGGSVTHISGVINELARQPCGVDMVSTDVIPMVSEKIKVRLIRPDPLLRDEPEANASLMNLPIVQLLISDWKESPPRFVYQRYSINNLVGLMVSEQLGVPLVLEYNGSELWVSRNWGGALKDEATAELIEQTNLQRADLIVVVSEVLAHELEGRGVEPERILVNPNGVDPTRYRPDLAAQDVIDRYGLTGRKVIGFIGSFGPWHGAAVLVEAFSVLLQERPELNGKVMLLMIGDGQEMPAVKSAVERTGLADSVVLTGTVSQEQGPEYLAACDILASPHVPNPDGSAFFGSPTKLFEYMAMGRPIVASDLEQIGDMLSDGVDALLVPPGDAGAMASAILRLIDTPDLAARLADNARAAALERHTWARHTERILTRLAEVTDRDP